MWVVHTFAELVGRARDLAHRGGRSILGLCGAPGSGKSTLARRLVDALPECAAYVPMDGFHLAGTELDRLGRTARKGAPDTFDALGYAHLLLRLRAGDELVYAPMFDRDLDEPVAGAIPVPPDVSLVVTEGNYLLLPEPPWHRVRPLLDEVWYLAPDERTRLARLIARHQAFGRTEQQAQGHALGSDQRNAELIAATVTSADLVLRKIQ